MACFFWHFVFILPPPPRFFSKHIWWFKPSTKRCGHFDCFHFFFAAQNFGTSCLSFISAISSGNRSRPQPIGCGNVLHCSRQSSLPLSPPSPLPLSLPLPLLQAPSPLDTPCQIPSPTRGPTRPTVATPLRATLRTHLSVRHTTKWPHPNSSQASTRNVIRTFPSWN